MKKSEYKCHVCGKPFNIIPQREGMRGVLLRCDEMEGCIPHENVYGFGDTEKAAAEIAKQKYKML